MSDSLEDNARPADAGVASGGLSAGAQFGMMNAFRSGNPAIDMMMCMMIPALFSFVTSLVNQVYPDIRNKIQCYLHPPKKDTRAR